MMSLLLEKLLIIVENKKMNKMKKIILSFLFVSCCVIIKAQSVLTIDNNNISLEEFKSIFYKNNHEGEINKVYLDEYMELFINFKLKVREAEELKMDTVSSFLKELEGYKNQLAAPYLKNKEFDENMVLEAYERMLKDVNASHILIAVNENASDKEDKIAYEKALSIRKEIITNKTNFKDAAKKYSTDKFSAENGGVLGYFTVFMMVYDFETAAYTTPVGEISMPVRTQYGYHIIKVEDIRDAVGVIEVAHIMFRTGDGASQQRLNVAKDKIYDIREKLNNGEEFADLAERFSEDRSTAVKGGKLPAFGVGKMVPEFESVAFGMTEVGETSKPFRTSYGWHIIKLLSKKSIGSLEEVRSDIRKKIDRDSRGELSMQALDKKLRSEYRVSNKVSQFKELRKKAVYSVANGNWNGLISNQEAVLFSIEKQVVKVGEFVDYILLNQTLGSDFDKMYQDFVSQKLLLFEKNRLEDKYPEYKALLKEYREGILLFDLTNKKVWKKAVEDTSGLESYFQKNIEQYQWGERVDATIYHSSDLATARKVRSYLAKKRLGINVSVDNLLNQTNSESPLSLQITSNNFSSGDNQYIDNLDWKVGISSDIKLEDGSFIIVEIKDILLSGDKKLEETRGKVISDYQNYLDQEWINELRNKYDININRKVLYSLIR